MQEIVFDDLNTPHFRLRGDVTEDKTLEELSKKPMTIMVGQVGENEEIKEKDEKLDQSKQGKSAAQGTTVEPWNEGIAD